jgi:fluoride exporter
MTVLYVALGGAIGCVARYLLGGAISRYTAPASPLSTFTVNIIGCFAFGLIAAFAERHFVLNPARRAFLLIGLLGGFTTFSSYTYDTFELLREARVTLAFANAAGQVILGFVALWAGYALAR